MAFDSGARCCWAGRREPRRAVVELAALWSAVRAIGTSLELVGRCVRERANAGQDLQSRPAVRLVAGWRVEPG